MPTHQKFLRQVKQLREAGARFLSLSVNQGEDGEFELDYGFDHHGQVEILKLQTEAQTAPSLIASFTFSDYPEREAYRQYRIKFLGNPNLPSQ